MTLEEQIYRADLKLGMLKAELKRLAEKKERDASIYPKKDLPIFILQIDGKVFAGFWSDNEFHRERFDQGVIFLTLDEAELASDRNKVETTLRRMTKGFQPDWGNGNQEKNYIFFDHSEEMVLTDLTYRADEIPGIIIFKDKEDTEAAIAEVGKEELKRVYGVKW